MKIKLIAIILLSQSLFLGSFAFNKGLIVTIDQQNLDGLSEQALPMLPIILGQLNFLELQDLGEAVTIFKNKISKINSLTKKDVIEAWDDSRALWIESKAKGKYNHVYIVQGELIRDNDYMQFIWQQAFDENDVVDYVSMVHGGHQLIKDEWNVQKEGGKLRMVYSEGCQGGSGKRQFIEKYHAIVSAGHKEKTCFSSASPLFSFGFLTNWFLGESFIDSLTFAWISGKDILDSKSGMMLAQFLVGNKPKNELLSGSEFEYSYNPKINVRQFNINSAIGENYIIDGQIVEDQINF